jgi:hypothetical protein
MPGLLHKTNALRYPPGFDVFPELETEISPQGSQCVHPYKLM